MAEIDFTLDVNNYSLQNLTKIDQLDVLLIKTPLFKELLPQVFTREDFANSTLKIILNYINDIAQAVNEYCKLVIVAESYVIPYIQAMLSRSFQYQQWFILRLKNGEFSKKEGLKNKHIGMLILTKYQKPLQHSKVRIKYTFCPYCSKTTKDYGGRKHLYHEYGTLMSDIWTDLEISRDDDFNKSHEVVTRVRDMFSIEEKRKSHLVRNNKMGIVSIKTIEEITHFFENKTVPNIDLDLLFPKFQSTPSSKEQLELSKSLLLNGDALVELQKLPDNSVDLIFVDPPYNVDKKYDSYNDSLEINAYFEWCDKWIEKLYRILKPGGSFFLLNIPLYSIRHFLYLQQRMIFQNWIVWDSLSMPIRNIMPAHYALLYYTKGNKPNVLNIPSIEDEEKNTTQLSYLLSLKDNLCIRNSCITKRLRDNINQYQELTDIWSGIHRLKHNSKRFDHPTQLPPALLHRVISIFSSPQSFVLDCFNGIGTTTLCAHLLNRRYIGIEISQKYYEIALQNHQEIEQGRDPFREKKEKPITKNNKVERQGLIKYKVPKKELQLYIKELANKLGHKPSREEVIKENAYPIEYFDQYFKGWGEVLAAVRTTGMSEFEVSPEILISYFKNLANQLHRIPSEQDIIKDAKYPIDYFHNYFQHWDEIAKRAGLTTNEKKNRDLFYWVKA